MSKLGLIMFETVVAVIILAIGYMMGGSNAVAPYYKAVHECEQALPHNEECVLLVVPKRMLQQAPAVAPTRV